MQPTEPFDLHLPPTLTQFFQRFATADFMPHGHCYFWRPEILYLHVISDLIIGLAYYSIPIILIYFIYKRQRFPFHAIFIMFGAFIFLCGTTHFMDVYTTWFPAYRIEGVIKLLTALVSIITAGYLIPILPKAVNFPRMESIIQDLSKKTNELSEVNKDLEKFNRLTVGREGRIMQLKQEVNDLVRRLGEKPRYDIPPIQE